MYCGRMPMGASVAHTEWLAADWPAPSGIVAGTTLRGPEVNRLPVNGTPYWLRQVHGNVVVSGVSSDTRPAADASVTADLDTVCVVRTADCLPVLFCSRNGALRAAAHAGWRGLSAGVLENTVAAMAIDPEQILVWMGPAISQPCFEVGDEVRQAFVDHDHAAASCFMPNHRDRWQADLFALARQRLASAGVSAVFGGGQCTFSEPEKYFSYRRNPDCDRILSFVACENP